MYSTRLMLVASSLLSLSLSLSLTACGDDDPTPMPDAPTGGADAGGSDGAVDDWQTLVTGDWSMPSGQEGYVCVRITVPDTTFVGGFRPIAPAGTHHTALSIADNAMPDGTYPCVASDVGQQLLFGSGVGTTAYLMPPGVAYRIEGGQQMLLNLHLYNTDDAEIVGTSGVEIQVIPQAEVVHEAESVYAGTFSLNIPPGIVTQSGQCTMNGAATIFGLFPHMHKTGTHIRAVVETAGGDMPLIDQAYSFESQLNYGVDPVLAVQSGDVVRVTCTYDNPGPGTINFGDSSDDEMCFLGLYRYPRIGGGVCFN